MDVEWEPVLVAALLAVAWMNDASRRPPQRRVARSVGTPRDEYRPSRVVAAAALLGILVVSSVGFGVATIVAGLVVAGLAAMARALVHRSRGLKLRRQRQLAVIEFCDALSAEFHAGLPAVQALERACSGWPEWRHIATAAQLGSHVPTVLHSSGALPGAEGLRAISAAWEVAGHSGAALTSVLDSIGRGLRNEEDARAEVIAALGPPRATAKLLAVLPVFGLALGTSMGAKPINFLVGETVGRICLVIGCMLAAAGLWWVERLAQSVEESS